MKLILASRVVKVPAGVSIASKSRAVTVTGPRGELTRSFRHVTISIVPLGKRSVRLDLWFGNRKQLACIRTVASHIENMMVGVTKGFHYKMRFAYAHFPINVTINGNLVEIRNFLGERRVRKITMLPGVEVIKSADVKDQLELMGNDVEAVSRSAALIHQSVLVRNKDIRKFLDGIYVAEKGPIGQVKPI
mmetsp:Transcript_38752/g.107664  ORF Transcript_38752/g.107664 Transcript_38752/m.107664 type:complete len:190 (+) Transcript_38752:12-581(+)